ncbi:MAG: hypothetical protein P8O07_08145 [Crocinitomicaceae bacterium]|nr:hypothetical protein [Crocinitomicaceae bacterium]
MKPSNELFMLIKSLNKSEKRFFKLSSTIQAGDKNYLRIFDFVDKQEEYDEEALKVAFQNETFIKHLPSEKNHLYKLILKSLRSYYGEQSISSILKQEIKNIEILYAKALYKECGKFLIRAKKQAREYEKFYYLFELIEWEKKLIEESYESGNFEANLNDLIEEETQVIEQLRNLAEYQILYSKINYIFRSGVFTKNSAEREVVDSIADNHLIKGKNTALSTRAASICYYIKGLCAATNRNYQDSYVFFNRTREILDHHPKLKLDLGKRYLLTLFHLVKCYIDDRNYDLAQQTIDEIKALSEQKGFQSTDLIVKISTLYFSEQLNLLNMKGDFGLAVKFIEDIQEDINRLGDKISKEQRLKLLFNSAYSYFGNEDYKRCLHLINTILNDNESTLRQDIFGFSRLLNLLVHLELENFDFLEYEIKSTNRFFNKIQRDNQIESFLIKNVRRLIKTQDDLGRNDIYENMYVDLNEILEDNNERVILEYFDILAWVYSKIKDIPLGKAIKYELEHS